MSRPAEITVDANGLTFGALRWGEQDAPLALLIHGYPDTAWTWRHLGPYLAARGWRAVAPFTRGYGPTGLAPDDRYLISDQVDDVVALHAALGGDARAVLVGHDWGAVATWGVTVREPERFARYVALSVPPTRVLLKPYASPRTWGLAARQARLSWYFVYYQLPGAIGGLDRVIPKLWRDWSPGYDATEDLAHVWESLDTRERRRAALRYCRNNLQGGLLKTFAGKAGAPALYLHGVQDGCMSIRLAELAPPMLPAGSRFESVAGVGHFLQLEDPERVNGLIADWLGAPA